MKHVVRGAMVTYQMVTINGNKQKEEGESEREREIESDIPKIYFDCLKICIKRNTIFYTI